MSNTNIDFSAVETKLAAARTRLILDKPFLGALVLRLPLIAASKDWCKTTATDARAFYYNPEFIDNLSMSQAQFMLAHEALHCALSHFYRREHRVKHRWDIACDFAINPLLVDDGLEPPAEALLFDQYRGMTAEEIYPLLDDNEQSETLDQHLYDDDDKEDQGNQNDEKSPPESKSDQKGDKGQNNQGNKEDSTTPPDEEQERNDESEGKQQDRESQGSGSQHSEKQQQQQSGQGASSKESPATGDEGEAGQNTKAEEGAGKPPPLTPREKENLSVQWQQRMAGAAQQAIQSGKFGGDMARIIDHMLQPRLPWRMLLADFMTSSARDDFSYMRPSRREGNAILPSLRSSQIDLAVAVDTSGSIREEEIEEFLSEIDAIKAQLRARIMLLPCDSKLADDAPWVYEAWEEVIMPDLKGGGGTSFVPVFDWVEAQDKSPDLLIYFTDAEGQFPEHEPPFPVIWLVKGKAKTPWGRRIQLN